jgi:staphylococcal nuclease domain-containing protein 1
MRVVLSGDTIVLIGKPRPDGKPPSERILSLAYVSAPRMKRDGDEVYTTPGRSQLS